jgi:predicted polyphosphate/ATP-dependent NAD kinase
MATTTFSGPIKAGTISNTTGTTVGTNMKNTGQVVMAQTHAIDLSGGALAAVATNVIIPANSQLIDIVFDSIVASSDATNISIGKVGGGAAIFVNTYAIGTTVGLKRPTTQAGGSLAWEDIGTTDVRLNVTNSAATTSGECRFTITYQQNNNLS